MDVYSPLLEATVLHPMSLGSLLPWLALVGLVGCSGSDIKLSAQATCDGVLQSPEGTVDSPFDADGDGFFDGANPDCAATYAASALDCNDGDPDIHPGAAEVSCDGVDNDCSADTLDSRDQDGDGYGDCEECDDSNPEVSPGRAEVTCNGIDDDCDDTTPDAEDRDHDGWDECDDCNDSDIYQSPGLAEIACNGIDDDCDDATPDAQDNDEDGASLCDDDCDDNNPERSPDFDETCDDGIDNNCDGEIDEACSYTGVWTLDRTVQYRCAPFFTYYLVDISFSALYLDDLGSSLTLKPTTGGSQPGTTYGTFTSDVTFSTSNTLPGGCTETYTFSGTFLDSNTMSGSFEATYTGGSAACSDCRAQSFIFSATR